MLAERELGHAAGCRIPVCAAGEQIVVQAVPTHAPISHSRFSSPRARAALWAAALLLAALNPLLCLTHCVLADQGAAPHTLGQAYICHPLGASVEPAGDLPTAASGIFASRPQALYAAALPADGAWWLALVAVALPLALAHHYGSWCPPQPKPPPRHWSRRLGSCRITDL